ncbi:Crp/Fnr family transcriptional regulator [Aquimarina sp. 2201CG5-10]|uniref:Crp/Fnr family transcriptional regulator n=1 Tax=Aquimarina callyspongiae TaxID=3098150 RepID=UPI002AB40BF8|nr:Crp/Fnr family transcriptional regulator [Aquimarina sp. 2201CG5-10]MDY8137471.1 Crp/Fnr family transcriptional regulator [Aquimarina sp. 2201CG5-10]
MHTQFISYIQKHSKTPIKANEIELIKRVSIPKSLKKKEFFLEKGKICRHLGFIVKGAMRQYSVDDRGVEHLVRLSVENWFVQDRESFTLEQPSSYFIDAWENTNLLVITKESLDKLMTIPAIAEISTCLDEVFAMQRRINATISMSAFERYKYFEDNYPEFIGRFPQHIIASYLGITKETLSRVLNKTKFPPLM